MKRLLLLIACLFPVGLPLWGQVIFRAYQSPQRDSRRHVFADAHAHRRIWVEWPLHGHAGFRDAARRRDVFVACQLRRTLRITVRHANGNGDIHVHRTGRQLHTQFRLPADHRNTGLHDSGLSGPRDHHANHDFRSRGGSFLSNVHRYRRSGLLNVHMVSGAGFRAASRSDALCGGSTQRNPDGSGKLLFRRPGRQPSPR